MAEIKHSGVYISGAGGGGVADVIPASISEKKLNEIKREAKHHDIENMMNVANKLWRESKNKEYGALSEEARMDKFQKENPDFCNTHPVVSRYMIVFRQFKLSAFKKYLWKLYSTPRNSEEDYYHVQASYAKYLFMEYNPREDKRYGDETYNQVYQSLKKEADDFKALYEKINTEIKAKEAKDAAERRDELKRLIASIKASP